MNIPKSVCILLLIALITFAGCVPGDGKHTTEKPAGFFWGIWHGWIAPISLIWGFLIRISVFMNPKTQDGGTISGSTSPLSVASVVSP